jgi:integrase
VLTDSELKEIWRASEELGYPYGTCIQLLILTGQRRDEVASMRWKEVDLSDRLWTIPRERTKADRVHAIPLTPEVMALIENLPKIHEDLVFPARGRDAAISGFSKWKKLLDQRSGVSGWRVHDIRRTVASGMARLGVQPHVVERVQNRLTGTFGGVAGVYNRYGYVDEMRDALTAWALHLDEILKDEAIRPLACTVAQPSAQSQPPQFAFELSARS